jgi:hypothetical protein
MRRQQSGLAAECDEFAAEILAGTVRSLPWIAFQRDYRFANEAVNPLLEFEQVLRQGKIDHASLLKVNEFAQAGASVNEK